MDFRVLGPVEVAGAEASVPLGGPKQRAVLAHLLVRANRVVSIDALIDGLWGEEPPERARATIQAYVHNLRRALGPARIESRAPGYVLRVEADEVDATRFETALGDARRLSEEPSRAADVLRDALVLWRGRAFADLDGLPSLRGEAARLDELHMRAIEDQIGFELAAGRHGEVLGELESLVLDHPMHERLWEHLMLARYRAGRQSDALAAFEAARLVLADELGIDPSPELRRLQEQILRQDSSLELGGEPLRGYRLLERVGEGAFGVVYRATQPQIGREVAIKAVHPELANHPDFVRRFEREAQIVARLEHPHIVPLYDYWREPDGAFLVMRHLRGGSVEDLIAEGPLSVERVATLLDQIAAALAAAHRQGVVHRDVKPGNVLLDEEGNAYLTDFGVALDAGSPERTSGTMMRGTSAYLSPEQVRLGTATPRSDVYALCIVLFEMLTGEHPYVESSLSALLERHLREPVPSLRDARPDLPRAVDHVIARATAKHADDRFEDVMEVAAAFRAASAAGAGAHEPVGEIRNPYKGLRAFLEADAGDFFGRESVTQRLLDRLAEPVEGARFIAVVGPSGSGKSSVVQAGLVPALRHGALPGSERWFVVDVLPGAHPFRELESALLTIAVEPPPSLLDELMNDDLGLVRAADRVLPDPDAELVIVLDQFEEVFTLVAEDRERLHLLASLRAAALEPESRVRVVATLRADFFDEPLSIHGFGDLLAARTEAIPPMSPEELERAIVAPADRSGLAVEPRLLAAMIADVIDRPGALPLLQYALTELAERRTDGLLTLEGYRRIGRVSGALARRAEQLFEAMNGTARDACRQMFLRLVTLGEGSEDTRRRVRRSELMALTDAPAMAGVIDSFGRHRLLSFDRDPSTREPTVEIAHEALLAAWDRLRDWIDEARFDIRTQRTLAFSVAEWEAAERDPSFLLRGARLDQVRAWVETTTLVISDGDRGYVGESIAVQRAAQERERALERRSIRRLRSLVALGVVAALVASTLTVIAVTQRGRAQDEARVARARELAAAAVANLDVDPERSILLAMEAVAETRSVDGTVLPEAEEALHAAVVSSRIEMSVSGIGGHVDWSPRRVFVTEGPDDTGVIDIRNAETGESVLAFPGHHGDVTDVAFSLDGSMLATTGDDGTLKVWDPSTGDLLASAHGKGEVWGPSFSLDGSVASAAWLDEGSVRVLNLATGRVERTISGVRTANGTALSPDGTGVAVSSGSESFVTLFEIASGDEVFRLKSDLSGQGPSNLSWSPDGRYVSGGTVPRVWDARTGRLRFSLVGHSDQVLDLDWSPDSSRLVTGAFDGTAKVWQITGGSARELMSLSAQDMRVVTGVAFSPDGTRVLTGDGDVSTAKIWDVSPRGDAEWANLPISSTFDQDVVFMPTGHRVLASGADASVNLWDPEVSAGGRLIGSFGRRCCALRVDVSADGATIAVGYYGGKVTVRDVATGDELFATEADYEFPNFALSPNGKHVAITLTGSNAIRIFDRSGHVVRRLVEERGFSSSAPVFSPDGLMLATVGIRGADVYENYHVRVWDWHGGEVVNTIGAGVDGRPVFDPTGAMIATPWDRRIEAWDVDSGEPVVKLPYQPSDIYGLAFSSDGSLIATGAADGTVRLFDAVSGEERLILQGPAGPSRVAFSADGSMLASTHGDSTVRVWALDIDDLLEIARQNITRSLTNSECRQYLHVEACPTEG